MAIFVEHIESGKQFLLVGTGYGMYRSDGGPQGEDKQGSTSGACVCDANGEISWINTKHLKVISVDGLSPRSIYRRGVFYDSAPPFPKPAPKPESINVPPPIVTTKPPEIKKAPAPSPAPPHEGNTPAPITATTTPTTPPVSEPPKAFTSATPSTASKSTASPGSFGEPGEMTWGNHAMKSHFPNMNECHYDFYFDFTDIHTREQAELFVVGKIKWYQTQLPQGCTHKVHIDLSGQDSIKYNVQMRDEWRKATLNRIKSHCGSVNVQIDFQFQALTSYNLIATSKKHLNWRDINKALQDAPELVEYFPILIKKDGNYALGITIREANLQSGQNALNETLVELQMLMSTYGFKVLDLSDSITLTEDALERLKQAMVK